MSRIYPEESWEDGDIYSLDEPNREFAAIVGEANGHVGVDNLSALLVTGAKVALDAFHEIIYIDQTKADAFSGATDVNAWETLESTTITTEDGMLKLIGQCTYDASGGSTGQSNVELGVLVDGQVAARSGWSGGSQESESPSCGRMYPVGPGTHTVELAIRRGSSLSTITVNGRTLFGRFLAR